eukprot:90070-Alexandrium_andersonii.AAC.1
MGASFPPRPSQPPLRSGPGHSRRHDGSASSASTSGTPAPRRKHSTADRPWGPQERAPSGPPPRASGTRSLRTACRRSQS